MLTSKYPKILVISNNSFSDVTNNGKTLASFFDYFPVDNIAQLYFNPEVPINTRCNNYYRITDSDVLKSVINNSNNCGKKIIQEKRKPKLNKNNYRIFNSIKHYDFARLSREFLWKTKKWNTKSFNEWITAFSPDIIFLCAGDSVFAYEITKYIHEKFNSKLVVYITDDYVLPRKSLSPFWWIRRNKVLEKMELTVQSSDLFITISQQMQEIYRELFKKESILAFNMTESLRDESLNIKKSDNIKLVYTGGLHFKRYLTLNALAKSLKQYNDNPINKQKVFLEIYSGQLPDKKILELLNTEGASKFCGSLNSLELKEVLNSCDIPVHVESFDQKSINSTRLSISTKIPEYLSLGKPILAIGPAEVASMEYLKDCAYCITNQYSISSNLNKLLNNAIIRDELIKKALLKYVKHCKKGAAMKESILNLAEDYEGKQN